MVNTITDWNEPPRARHQVSYALAKIYKVAFISSNKFGFFGLKKSKISENLDVIFPSFPILVKIRIRIPLLNKLYQKWLYKKLTKLFPESTVINFDFTAKFLPAYFTNLIYYCNDDHIGISKKYNSQFVYTYQSKSEKIVASSAAFCIGTSEYLVEQLKKHNANSYLIKLGAPTVDSKLLKEKQKRNNNAIKVGCVGFSNTIDMELIKYLVQNKDLHITLIGPFDNKTKREFSPYSNFNFTGPLYDDDLFKEINNLDVGIIPYSLKSTIDRTPNKLWQYLALGKPVVISYTKGIKNWIFPDYFVYRANSYAEFYAKIIEANSKDSLALTSKRIEFARKNSWDKRVNDLIELCHEYLD